MVVGIVCFYFLSPFCLSVSSKFSTLNNYCLYNKQKKFLFQKTKERTLGWNSGALFFSCAANYLVVGLQGITLISKQKGPELTGSISKMEWFSKMYGGTGQAIPFVLFFVPYLLSAYHVPGTVTQTDKTLKSLPSWSLQYRLFKEMDRRVPNYTIVGMTSALMGTQRGDLTRFEGVKEDT